MRKLSIALAVVALSACASAPEQLQRASAISIGGNISPDAIMVSNIDRGVTSVSWTAQARGRTYACSADDMVRTPYCSTAR